MTEEHIGLTEPERLSQQGLDVSAAMEQHDLARRTTETTRVQWWPLIGGGLLIGYGLRRGEMSRPLVALAGVALAAYGISGRLGMRTGRHLAPDGGVSIRVRKSVTVNLPPQHVYEAWHNVEDFPRFMSHLESVRRTGDRRSHWVAKAPMGQTVEWDAEVFHDDENRVIAWRSIGDADIANVGAVHFDEAPGGRGTEVTVTIEYMPPAGRLGATIAKLFGEEPGQQVEDDLRRFKQFMETGEIPTTHGQPRGAHTGSRMDAAMDKARQAIGAADSAVIGRDPTPER